MPENRPFLHFAMRRLTSGGELTDHDVLVLLLLREYLSILKSLSCHIHIFFFIMLCDYSQIGQTRSSFSIQMLSFIRSIFC